MSKISEKEHLVLHPSEIRFSQDTIKSRFQNGNDVNVTAEFIYNGSIDVNNFHPMEVYKENGKYYTRNNRMLYAYRAAEFQGGHFHLPVIVVQKDESDYRKFTTTNDGLNVKVRNNAETLPHHCPHCLPE